MIGFYVQIILIFLSIVIAIIFFFEIIGGCINKKRKKVVKSLIVFVISVLCAFLSFKIPELIFLNIPHLYVQDNSFTVIIEGPTGSRGSHTTYDYSKDGILQVTDTPFYRSLIDKKSGYTFEGTAPGKLYVLIVEDRDMEINGAEIYDVTVKSDLSLDVTLITTLKIGRDMKLSEFVDYIADEYGFSKEKLEKHYRYELIS